ncbi:MAG: hypothetical protein R8P61_26740 [Bacteroidia bacterium]|nr:hypothetical protein [Bacteroidia bacterium]
MKNPYLKEMPCYPQKKTDKWLSWLAKNMQQQQQTIFMIEQLQSSWLTRKGDKRMYWIFNSFFEVLVFIPICIVNPGMLITWLLGLIIWIFYVFFSNPKKIERAILPIGGVLDSKSNFMARNKYMFREIKNIIKERWILLTLIGIFFGSVAGIVGSPSILVMEFYLFFFIGFLLWIYLVCIVAMVIASSRMRKKMISDIAKAKSVFETDSLIPNYGIKKLKKDAFRNGKNGMFISGFVGAILIFVFSLSIGENVYDSLIYSLLGAIWAGFSIGLLVFYFKSNSGIFVIRHYALRFYIYIRGYGPWNYERFLDYVVNDLQFMQQVGGGYIFIHRMLMEYFADLDENNAQIKKGSEQSKALSLGIN